MEISGKKTLVYTALGAGAILGARRKGPGQNDDEKSI